MRFRSISGRCRRFVSVLVITVALAGCGSSAGSSPASDRPLVLTTFTVIADMGRAVAGDRLDVASITKVGAEIHGYEPTPSDLRRASDADLVLENGLGLEAWFEQFISRAKAPRVTLTAGIAPIPIAGQSSYAGRANPHAWMSTSNAVIYVENIRKAFTDLDPAGAEAYRANADAYLARIRDLGANLKERLGTLPTAQRALVTCEGAFSYLARDAGLREVYLWPINAEQEGTPRQIAEVVSSVRTNQVPAVFCESTVSDKAQQQVARESGARFGGTLYVDSLSGPDGPVPTYLDLLRYDAEVIVNGLTGPGR